MPKINVVNADNIIEYTPQKAYFKLKNTGGPKGDKGDQGDPGLNATITVASTTTGASGTNASVVNQGTEQNAQLAFTIPRGEKGEQGDPGARGFSPVAWVVRGDDYVQINVENEHSISQAKVYDGANGQDGQDGYSPSASVTQTATGATISVTDEQGTTTADILNGTDGTDGQDGYSPIATVTQTAAGATISITDKNGTTTADVTNGTDGIDGTDGTDGYSPSATVTQTSTGATITITDKDGTTTANITNGQDAPTYTAGTNVQINNGVISATDTTYSAFTGSTSSADGSAGLVPQPLIADTAKYLKGDGTWSNVTANLVEMSYGESNAWTKFINAYNNKSIVYCRASSNANPGSGAQTRRAFMAYVNNETTPTTVEFQYYRSVNGHTDSQQMDQVFIYTLSNTNGGTWSVTTRDATSAIAVSGALTKSYSNNTITLTPSTMVGADSSTAGSAGVVPTPSAGDDTKYLRGDGTWATVSAGPTVVQTTGQSTTDVMSQKAVTDIIGNVETLLHTLNSGSGV